jgi:hypothetical protein
VLRKLNPAYTIVSLSEDHVNLLLLGTVREREVLIITGEARQVAQELCLTAIIDALQ